MQRMHIKLHKTDLNRSKLCETLEFKLQTSNKFYEIEVKKKHSFIIPRVVSAKMQRERELHQFKIKILLVLK